MTILDRIAQIESGGNPNARATTSSASGLFQFTDPTWAAMVKKYGARNKITLGMKSDPAAQLKMAELLMQENARLLKAKTGQTPNATDLYLAHFLGGPAAAQFKQNLGKNAFGANIFPQAAKANPNIFYENQQPRTLESIYALFEKKMGVPAAPKPLIPPQQQPPMQIAAAQPAPQPQPQAPGGLFPAMRPKDSLGQQIFSSFLPPEQKPDALTGALQQARDTLRAPTGPLPAHSASGARIISV